MPVIIQSMEHYQPFDANLWTQGRRRPVAAAVRARVRERKCAVAQCRRHVRGAVQGAVTRSDMTSIVRRRYEPHGS